MLQGSGGTDFVLNDALPFTGNPMNASEEFEEIPFTLSYIPTTGAPSYYSGQVDMFSFRPDPALYLAIMCGQLQIVIDTLDLPAGTASVTLEVSAQVAGWKSIMGNPDTKRRRRSKKSKK